MPEDIAKEPLDYKRTSKLPQPVPVTEAAKTFMQAIESKADMPVPKFAHEQIGKMLPKIRAIFKEKMPTLTDDDIDAYEQDHFGGLSLPRDILNPTATEVVTTEKMVKSASLQARMIHNIFFASTGEASEEFVQKVANSLAFHDQFANSAQGQKDNLRRFHSGVRAFLGVSRSLYNAGFDLYLPNYNGNRQEIEDWDVRNGIDGCAITKVDGVPIAIVFDAKGQMNYNEDPNDRVNVGQRHMADFEFRRLNEDSVRRLPYSLQDLLSYYDPSQKHEAVYKAKIVLPTGSEYLTSFKDAYRIHRRKGMAEVLAKFANVDPYVKGDIDKNIDRILRVHSLKQIAV